MQACARIGATHSVVFGGFSAKSVQERIVDAGAVALITADGQYARRQGDRAQARVRRGVCAWAAARAVQQRDRLQAHGLRRADDRPGATDGGTTWCKDQPEECAPTPVNAEHPLFILYTSGSTGKPKGVQHSTGGYLLQRDAHDEMGVRLQADGRLLVHRRRRLGDRAHVHRLRAARGGRDRGDVRGRADLSRRGPLLEDDPGPQGDGVLHRAHGDPLAHQGGRRPAEASTTSKSLRILGTVGEPINPEAWMWYFETVGGGRCPIVDTWWQTETGGHMITPLPGATPLKPGSCTLPLPGIMADIVDETGQSVGQRQGRHPGDQAAVALDDPHHLGRPGALPQELLPRGVQGQVLPRGRRRQHRRGRLLPHHGPHRRRAERLRPPAGHHGDRERAGGQLEARRRGGGRGAPRRPHGGGGRGVRGDEGPASER